MPSLRHQKVIDRIRASITPQPPDKSGCHHVSDAALRFPDDSLKRPDIAIFCTEPPDLDEAWEQVPEAVIEIVSPDYAEKDVRINPPWYLAQGVKAVVVFEPREGVVVHCSQPSARRRQWSSICNVAVSVPSEILKE